MKPLHHLIPVIRPTMAAWAIGIVLSFPCQSQCQESIPPAEPYAAPSTSSPGFDWSTIIAAMILAGGGIAMASILRNKQ